MRYAEHIRSRWQTPYRGAIGEGPLKPPFAASGLTLIQFEVAFLDASGKIAARSNIQTIKPGQATFFDVASSPKR